MRKYAFTLLVLIVFDVQAAIFCVSSGNDLGNAMSTARGNGEHDEIRVTTGTHTSNLRAPEAPQFFLQLYLESDSDKNLTISGGWSTGNNCATQSLNPSHTVLDALYFGPTMHVEFGDLISTSYAGTFTLKNMTLNRGKTFSPFQATGIAVFGRIASPGSVVLDNLHMVGGSTTTNDAFALAMQFRGSGSIRLRNSIVSSNSLSGSNSGPVLINPIDSNVVAYISNNSIFANSSTSAAAGLLFRGGTGTVSNNAVADNTSTANPSYQFYSDAASGLTLTKNHFGTKAFPNGNPFLETDTTTGNAFWTGLGVERIPQDVSPLRDSGNNSPVGGALAIDFRGTARVVNTIIDRGASEAPLTSSPSVGPIVTDNLPVKGSTTWLYAEAGQTAFGEITFSSSGGGVGGLTTIECEVTSGTLLYATELTQFVATGQVPQPIVVGFDNVSTTVQSGAMLCTFQRGGIVGSSFAAYAFKGSLATLFEDGFENP